MRDEMDHIQAFALGLAVGGEAISRMCFVVYLQGWGLVFVEGAVEAVVGVGL